ncbi:MAG TPA: cytochrome c, partial [Fimbriimonadaceae bacterium]|nr:cytochrome c [Fimbriimonadaceae bacterium]
MRSVFLVLLSLALTAAAFGQGPEVYGTSNCMGCHGQTAMGGLGPPIAKTKLSIEEYQKIVREGKGMMPATTKDQVSDAEIEAIYNEVKALPYDETQIPLAFKVGQMLSTRNVGILFLFVGLFSLL